MAKTTDPDKVVLIDDELHNVVWLVDYLEGKGFSVLTASNVREAIDAIEGRIHRALIIDLNIPIDEHFKKAISGLGGVYAKFPGLFVAERARNQGYRGRQVVIYSVHKDNEVENEVNKLGCTYIVKGRPRMIREEIDEVVSFDPTAEDDGI